MSQTTSNLERRKPNASSIQNYQMNEILNQNFYLGGRGTEVPRHS